MFAARGLAISFSVFLMVYCALSLAVCLTWRKVWLYSQKHPVRRAADMLFAVRIFPLVTAAVITAAFTVPSFLLLEPRAIDEPLGGIPLGLGICGTLLGIFGLVNAGRAMRRASRTISGWTRGAQPAEICAPVPVLRIARTFPAMTATGILRPRVLLSSAAEFVLNTNELQTALNHEVAHVRRRDNLKKLVLRFIAFPGMSGLETAWLEATEMAADDAAVSNAGDALDLAAALIKLSRLGPVEAPIDLTAALVHSPASSMNARVARLIAWCDERRVPARKHSPWLGVGAAVTTVLVCAVTYSHLLVRVHSATEWLVK
jgi:beta-lactamase regulating signal transducer with metallopeptidase domain